ncbi:hypothetical protein ACSTJP_00135, partial [Vibrio parahaemolyticus]
RIDVRGAADIPILGDKIVASLAFSTKHRDGWQRRVGYTGPTDANPIYLAGSGGAYGGPVNTNTDDQYAFPITPG